MKLITQRDTIRTVAQRFLAQYSYLIDDPSQVTAATISRRAQYEQLKALNVETVTPEEIAALIGNTSWTTLPPCNECGRDDLTAALEVGGEPDYEPHTVHLCRECAGRVGKVEWPGESSL